MFRGLDLYFAEPAQRLITAGQDLDDLDRDRSDVWMVVSEERSGKTNDGENREKQTDSSAGGSREG